MAMVAGSVTSYSVDTLGNATFVGTGLALALANARATANLALAGLPTTDPLPPVGSTIAPYSTQAPATATLVANVSATLVAIYNATKLAANADAVIVTYITTNATAHVTSQQLGRVPSGGAGTPIDAPSAPVDVPII